jgi:flagellin
MNRITNIPASNKLENGEKKMYGINTSVNTSVLASLRQINSDISATQTRIGTGKKINSASDNAAVWSTSQSIKSDLKAQEGLTSGIAVAKGKADTAVAAIDTIVNLLGQIKTIAASTAANPPSSYTAVTNQVTALKAQITAAVAGAKFQGINLLSDADGTLAATIGVAGGTAQTVSVTTIRQDDTADTLGVFNAIGTITDAATATTLSTGVDTAVAALGAYQASLSTFSTALGIQADFQKTLSGIRQNALSELLDADLTEESAKVTALQTQQQLAYQALSIGNSSSQNILRLFQ